MLRKLTMGDESLFQSILVQFQDETERDIKKLTDILKDPEPKGIRDIVHKLAGRVGQMGALTLSTKLHDIENEIVDGTPLSELLDEIIEAKDEVTKLLNSIRLSTLQQSSS
jgi:HPt (histidine-containing phosphotransfer) domain-containing protein